MHETPPRRYSAAEVARLLGISETTIAHYIRRLGIANHRPGTRFRFTDEQVAQLQERLAARLARVDRDERDR